MSELDFRFRRTKDEEEFWLQFRLMQLKTEVYPSLSSLQKIKELEKELKELRNNE